MAKNVLILITIMCLTAPAFAIGPQTLDPTVPTGSGGGTTCPAFNDLSSCRITCDCRYENAKKSCATGNQLCLSLALSQRNACYDHCNQDFGS